MRNRILIIMLSVAFLVAVIVFFVSSANAPIQNIEAVQEDSKGDGKSTGIVLINEVMASNSGAIPDNNGEFSDFIELYNPGTEPINMTGWGITDDKSKGAKWIFPNFELAPKSYIIVYCSGVESQKSEAFHTSFRISASKDTIIVSNASGEQVDILPLEGLAIPKNNSMGRNMQNMEEWVSFQKPTPGYENSDKGRADYEKSMDASSVGLIINEVQSSNKTTLTDANGEYSDWIELYNPTSKDIDISGFGLSDSIEEPKKWEFPQGSKIKAGEYLIIFCSSSSLNEKAADFGLSSYKETVVLSDSKGRTINTATYEEIPADSSFGKDAETGEMKIFAQPTPGYPNTEEGYRKFSENAMTATGDLYISEVLLLNDKFLAQQNQYFDMIELHNRGNTTLDISGYGVTNNAGNPAKFRFPEGTILEPNQYKIVMATGTISDETKKKFEYLNCSFALSNENGETITLFNKEGKLLDKLNVASQRNGYSFGKGKDGKPMHYMEPTPGEANGQGYAAYAKAPAIDQKPGLYSGNQMITLSGGEGKIYYTTDGSIPTEKSSAYSGAITVDKTTVIRARSFVNGFLPSPTETASFFIDSPHASTLSIVSLSTNPENFYDNATGMYAMGPNASAEAPFKGANFWQEWEKPVHFEIFDTNGNFQVGQDAAIRIFGAYSRGREQKGLALIPRTKYGPNKINYPIFENRPYDSYDSLTLRASGQDATVTKLRDIVATGLVDGTTNLEVAAHRQAVVYLNGEYFGIYNIREKINKSFIAQHFPGVNPENLDLLVGNGTALKGDNKHYKALLKYCEENNLKNKEAYDYVASKIDIDNYIDYLVAEMYIANTDTGNIKWFRERKEGSKYRWIYYDFCWSLSNYSLDMVSRLLNPEGHGVGKGFSTQLNRSLMQNADFVDKFLKRFAELLNTIYTPENVMAHVEKAEKGIEEEMERDAKRWPEIGSKNNWRNNVKKGKEFAEKRPDYMIKHLKDYFKLSDSETKSIFGRLPNPVE